ncbi:proteasome endopeptidase complex, beta subunit [Natrinema pellirubrum DSM 15624]|uniref:Proteasome subunit beta n=1 Tax=Natrinema pellirubrum (strain DSM 15624 / CIP 106293 / JCM 10476 / NCIMB 786 / 157) TaxID=797303 RepID=L0JLJ3_NATP1|nr:archaeal proteasome endopeptidase complex subunit beta [Natrinema pellirubrum]AGB32385.1 proteasome endopeptidase complex, archaeal, beta subunit [Natrinema pellirubrum DSM 15624]ELY73968.1 proteasome endopeptidase complex, beta subunit [Natrinema pellirubrum DSM 15624]
MHTPTNDSDFSRTVEQLADDPNPYEPEVGSLPENDLTQADLENVNKTGTTTIGISTADGVVIATDMRASLGGRFVSNKNVQKVEQIHPTGALTLVGSVGGAQSFISTLRAEVNLYEARRGENMSIEALATLAGNFARGGPFFAIHPILGGVDDEGSHVYSIDPAGGVMEDDYTVTGSGMQLAYGHLEQAYEPDMSTEEAKTVAARGIKSAVERDTGSGNGVFLCEITDEGVDIHGHHDFDDVL